MKKNYIAPIVRNINLDTEALIASSPNFQMMDDPEGISNKDDVMSNKRNSIWGDE